MDIWPLLQHVFWRNPVAPRRQPDIGLKMHRPAQNSSVLPNFAFSFADFFISAMLPQSRLVFVRSNISFFSASAGCLMNLIPPLLMLLPACCSSTTVP